MDTRVTLSYVNDQGEPIAYSVDMEFLKIGDLINLMDRLAEESEG